MRVLVVVPWKLAEIWTPLTSLVTTDLSTPPVDRALRSHDRHQSYTTFLIVDCYNGEVLHYFLLELERYLASHVGQSDQADLTLDIEAVGTFHHALHTSLVSVVSILLESNLTETFTWFSLRSNTVLYLLDLQDSFF